jgi:crotonobetaine/carnitine-CoA ligase
MQLKPDGFISLFLEISRRYPDRPFVSYESSVIYFSELERQSRAFSVNARRLGLKRGDRVAVMLANSPTVMATLYGIARSGLVWVPLNPELRGENLAYLIEHSSPSAIIFDESNRAQLENSGAKLNGICLICNDLASGETGSLGQLLAGDPSDHTPPPRGDDLFAVMYTSGTTGRPKGVMVTHNMMCYAARAAVELADARDNDVLFMWEPLYHIGGAQVMLMPLLRELKIAMVKRFSASRFWDQVEQAHATHIHYLGGVLQILMKNQQPIGIGPIMCGLLGERGARPTHGVYFASGLGLNCVKPMA